MVGQGWTAGHTFPPRLRAWASTHGRNDAANARRVCEPCRSAAYHSCNKTPSRGKNRTIEFCKKVCYTSGMDNKAPVAPPDAGQTPGKLQPFNEVPVLFPLLSIYTAGYIGLMIADFCLKRAFDLPDGMLKNGEMSHI